MNHTYDDNFIDSEMSDFSQSFGNTSIECESEDTDKNDQSQPILQEAYENRNEESNVIVGRRTYNKYSNDDKRQVIEAYSSGNSDWREVC
ncbi:hypothetical protein SNEBB_009396 [Seison nebaliae]|nr:hypothetical protein SNEBB_009396 [Seison nebaliae]